MTSVIASIKPNAVMPQRLVGAVTVDKSTGMLTIEYREPGKVKPSSKVFNSNELIAYQSGEAGFVVALSTDPIVRLVGELTVTKGGQQALKTEAGVIYLNQIPGVSVELSPVEADSREARAVERGSKVKVRGSRKAATGTKTSSRAERRAKAASGKTRAAKTEKAEAAPAKKKRRREKA